MNAILQLIADMLCAYGHWGAGRPSNHGAYEEDIPPIIQESMIQPDEELYTM